MSARADGKLLTEIKHTKQGLYCMVSFWIAMLKTDKNFDVSQQAAKIRLVDLGYTKAEGAYLFERRFKKLIESGQTVHLLGKRPFSG